MKTGPTPGTRVRFGTFEADLSSGELRRDGLKVKIQDLPFQVLVALLERPGEVVTREELRKRLWSADTFVDFEHGLSKAINKLRQALDDDFNNPRFVETLTRRGYRFIGPVEAAVGLQGGRSKTVWVIAFITAVIVVVLGALFLPNVTGLRNRVMRAVRAAREPPRQIHSIAVLPVENLSGDPQQEYFADGMTDELITELGKISALTVIGRTSVMRYKGSDKPIRDIAHDLNVDAVIEASVLRSGNRIRINARLVDGSRERILWKDAIERDLGNVLVLTSNVARAIAREIRIKLTPGDRQRLASAQPVNPKAFLAYLRGRFFLSKRTGVDVRRALDYFKNAAEMDTNYAPAYAGIADAYIMLAYYGPIPPATANTNARAAALKAIALDNSLAEAHGALAEVFFHSDWNWSGAEREFRQAIDLNSGYPKAHLGYSVFLSAMGRHAEAIEEIRKAQVSDPYSLIIKTAVGSAFFYSGKYDLAIRRWESIRKSDPDFWVARLWMGLGYLEQGRHNQALQELETAAELSKGNPNSLANLGYGYAVSGKTGKARQILDRLRQKSREGYVSPYQFAKVHAALGETDQAIKHLEVAFRDRYTLLVLLNQPRQFLSLHSDPRFQTLVRRMHFPP